MKWEFKRYQNIWDARSFALANGWRKNPQAVQIRKEGLWYIIEPFEENCNCPKIIKPF